MLIIRHLILFIVGFTLTLSVSAQTRDYMQVIKSHATCGIESLADSVLKKLAPAYEAMNQYQKANAAFEELYKRDTLDEQSILDLARINTSLGNYNASIKYLDKIYQTDTTNLYIQYQLAEAYLRNGEFKNTLKFTDKIKQCDSSNYYVWNLEAQSYQALEKNDKALEHYSKALELNRPSVAIALRYLTLATKNKMTDTMMVQAISICDSTLNYNPDEKRILRVKGQIMFLNKNFGTADSIFRMLLNERDSSYITLKYAAMSADVMDENQKAIELFEKAKKIDSTDVSLLLSMAGAYVKARSSDGGETNITRAEQVLTPDPNIWSRMLMLRGDVSMLLKKNDLAASYYWQAYDYSGNTNFNMLNKIFNIYQYKQSDSQERRGRAILPLYLLATNHILKGEALASLPATKMIFKYCLEDAFWEGVDILPLTAPDDSQIKISVGELSETLDKLNRILPQ